MSLTINYSDPLLKTDRTAFLGQLNSNSYQHILRSIGGYFSATIQHADTVDNLDDWIQNGLARHIDVYNPELEKIFEGFVNQININLGPLQLTIGPFTDLANRVSASYSDLDYSVYPPVYGFQTFTSDADNTDSQAIFGIIKKVTSLGGMSQTLAEQYRDTFLAENSWPIVSRRSNLLGGSGPDISLDILGYWHFLKLYTYTDTTTGDVDLSTKLQSVIAAEPNSLFSTDYSMITANTLQVPAVEDNQNTGESILMNLAAAGDASDNRYNIGCFNDRRFVYEVIPTDFEYQQRITENAGVTNKIGRIIQPWNVKAGKWIFYPDFLVGKQPHY